MKTLDTTNAFSGVTPQGAPITSPGRLPAKLDTVTAGVLARLLRYERLYCLDAVDEASTTRLSAVMHYLAKKYGWPIESVYKATGCRDGRVAWVAEYFLAPEIVACAIAAGAGDWCVKARTARNARRAHAAQAQREAERANAARKALRHKSEHPGLFEGGL